MQYKAPGKCPVCTTTIQGDFQPCEFCRIIEEVLNGTLEDPTIVDVTTTDPTNGLMTVKVYVE